MPPMSAWRDRRTLGPGDALELACPQVSIELDDLYEHVR